MPKSSLQKIREAPASTKARILEAAEEVFATRGFEGASTREIAARAGVNISSLHYHWESKETLYFAVFQNVYDRLVDISSQSVVPKLRSDGSTETDRDDSVGRLFDFFLANPNVPRLLLRRVLENEEFGEEIERDILVPAWKTFAGWVQEFTGRKIRDLDAQMLMLTVHSTLLLFTLDSRQYGHILGAGMTDAELARRVRGHLVRLTSLLVAAQSKS